MREWKETTLAELCSDIPHGYTESAKWERVGPKFLRITDIANGRLDWSSVPYCPITAENFKRYILPGDIVIVRTGATTGANYTIREKDPKEVVSCGQKVINMVMISSLS
jgi:type I restriction enzyme S subunit